MIKFFLLSLALLPAQLLALELKVGDLLLQPLQCWTCQLIMAQEKSAYAHMGIVVMTEPKIVVAEALGAVRTLPLTEFRKRSHKVGQLSVLRFKDQRVVDYLEDHREQFVNVFNQHFSGLEYDDDFLWDNFDGQGREKLYCSEMVAKLLTGFLQLEMPIKRMKYDINRALWIEYFRKDPPDGKWGNAPADFEKSGLFYEVGKL